MCEVIPQTLLPWQMTINGRVWRDMPGVSEEDKKMNFFFYRRGTLDVEEERICEEMAADGITVVKGAEDGEGAALPRLISLSKKNYGRRFQRNAGPVTARQILLRKKNEASKEAAKQKQALDAAHRAAVKARLMVWRQSRDGAMKQISVLADVNYDNLTRFVREGNSMSAERLKRVVVVLDALDAGEMTLRESARGAGLTAESRAVQCPEGMMPFKQWVLREAEKLGLQPHSVYAWLHRNPDKMPPIHKVHGKAWFVKPECVVAGFVPSARWLTKRRNQMQQHEEVAA